MRVFVTGGSGFVGSAVIDELGGRGHDAAALVHSRPPRSNAPRVDVVKGGLFDTAALDQGMRGADAVIHLVGIIMEKPRAGVTFERIHHEGTRAVVDAAQRNGIRRYVHMSALGVRPDAASEYHRTKHAAEEYVRASGLDWTIIRPSMIHGPRGDFMRMEAGWARGRAAPFLFMPYFGGGPLGRGGAGMLQPVYVGDVARAFADALENPRTVGEVYPLGGPEQMTWPQLHRTAAEVLAGKPRRAVAIPAWYAKLLTRAVPSSLLPFNRDQVIMSQEDNTCDVDKFVTDFGWTPRPFRAELERYAGEL